jgi:hypothetical protein
MFSPRSAARSAAFAGEGPLKTEVKRSAGREKVLPTENCCTSSFS